MKWFLVHKQLLCKEHLFYKMLQPFLPLQSLLVLSIHTIIMVITSIFSISSFSDLQFK